MTLAAPPAPAPAKRRSQGGRVCRFIEDHCVFTNGEWIGQPFRLQPWQKRLIYALFEVGDDGLRRYRWALIGLPKKNGKTELIAALDLYFLIADGEPSPLVVCGAASDDQADLVFGAARTMVTMSPTLRQICEPFDREIVVPSSPGAKLQRVAAAAGTNDGKNIHVASLDELHEWVGTKGRNVHTVLTNGTGARRQPMIIQITTAGHDKESVAGEQYEYGRRIQSGEVDDPRYFFHWVEAPTGADWRDPKVWEAANPSYGMTVRQSFFEDQLKKGESIFRRYFLNTWVEAETAWLAFGVWDGCADPSYALDPQRPVKVGIDISNNQDATAVAVAQLQGQDVVLKLWRVWSNPYPPNHTLHDSWTVPRAEVKETLREIFAAFPVPAGQVDDEVMPGPEFCYDPWNFREAADELTGDGLNMVEMPQNHQRMVPAAGDFQQTILTGRLKHDGDPILARHIANVTPDPQLRGIRISKPKGSKRQIDAAVASAIAVHRALIPAPERRRSIYEDRGLATV